MIGSDKSSEQLWFLNTHVAIRLSTDKGQDGLSILEHHAPYKDSPPMHVHHTEDEVFQILEGEFRFRIGEEEHNFMAGAILRIPKNVPHSYCVETKGGGHWITITTKGDFERLVRAVSRPAASTELPKPAGEPTPEEAGKLAEVAAGFGIEITGPPIH